ncbi:MAG: type IV secretion system DNA-binding domain-containing protein [Acidobacteriaceae bacterium]
MSQTTHDQIPYSRATLERRWVESIVAFILFVAAITGGLWYLYACLHFSQFVGAGVLWPYVFHPFVEYIDAPQYLGINQVIAWLALLIGVSGGLWSGYYSGKPRQAERQTAGRRLINDTAAAAGKAREISQAELGKEPEYYHIHPKYALAHDRASRGFLIAGSQGSGKTQIILPLIMEALADKKAGVLIHDFKGDFTEYFLDSKNPDIQLFAPWDSRSCAWDISSDIQNLADARELARVLTSADVATGESQSWASGAAQITAALITSVHKSNPRWRWGDLQQVLGLPYKTLRELALDGDLSCGLLMNEGDKADKTTMSFMSRLASMVAPVVSDFARAERHDAKRISFRNWMIKGEPRILILQNSTSYQTMAQSILQSAMRACASAIDAMPDSRTRKRWFFLDELPQMGKLQSLPRLLEVGRSKGVRAILAFQDISQMREIHGNNIAQALSSMAGTHIYARAQGGETPRWLSEQVGEKTIWRLLESVNNNHDVGGSTSVHYQSAEEPVIRPENFGSAIGVVKTNGEFRGVVAFLVDGGEFVLRLRWPAALLPKIANAASPADWTTELVDTDAAAATSESEQEQPALNPLTALDELDALIQQPKPTPTLPRFALRQPQPGEAGEAGEEGKE